MLNPKSGSSFTVGLVHPDVFLIHYVTNHILRLRKRKFSHLTKSGIVTVWFFSNKVKKNWVSAVIHHMIGSKKKGLFQPYGDLITKSWKMLVSTLDEKKQNKI